MMARGIKLNRDMCNAHVHAQVIITGKNLNLQNMHWHEKCPPPTGARAAKEDGAGVSGLGGSLGPPAGPAGDHTRADATAA